jgi:class 3 adenylate cyclase
MDWDATLKIAGGLVTLGGVTVALAKFFSNQNKTLTALRTEITELKTRADILARPMSATGSVSRDDLFKQLVSISTQARDAVMADLHSISVPVPTTEPKFLKIILSSDADPGKVLGREIPLTEGRAAWVFRTKQPSLKNPGQLDPKYFDKVDKAAGTNTGTGAMLTIPLITANTCVGVVQFMKTKGGRFEQSDQNVAMKLAPSITQALTQMNDSDSADVPSVAHGKESRCSVLFADITEYSGIAAEMGLHETVSLLNEYYSRLLPLAVAKGGNLEEYLGDGLYVSFFHESAGQAARLAVSAAFEMHAEYQAILNGWKLFQHPVSDRNTLRVGIASGIVYTGWLGDEEHRRKKLIGAPVNLAAHLCADAKSLGGGIAICPQTKELVGNEWPDFKGRKLDRGEAWTVTPVTKSV